MTEDEFAERRDGDGMKAKRQGSTPDAFIKQLKSGVIPTAVTIAGEEIYYRDLVRHTLLDAIFTDIPEESREITLFEERTDLRKLETLVNTYPFFGGRTVVLITDKELLNPKSGSEVATGKGRGKNKGTAPEGKQEWFQRILTDVPDFCTVILQSEKMDGRQKLTKFLQKETAFVDCSPVDSRTLPTWLVQQAALHKGTFTGEAINRIQEYLATVDNPPLQLLAKEVEKVAVYAGKRKNWTAEDVDLLFSALPEAGAFALNNAIAAKNLPLVLQLLAEEKQKNTFIVMIIARIAANLRNLLMVKEGERLGYSASQIAEQSRKSPFVVNLWKRDSARFTEARLRNGVQSLDKIAEAIGLGGRQYERLEEVLAILCS